MTEWSWHAVHLKSPYRVVVPPEYVSGRLGAVGDDAGEVHGAALLQVHVGPAQDLGEERGHSVGLCGLNWGGMERARAWVKAFQLPKFSWESYVL